MRSSLRLLALLAVVVLVACGDDDGPVTAGDSSTVPGGQPLAPHYVSVEVTEREAPRPLVEGTDIQLRFEETTVGASLGCNSMSGPYRLEGEVLVVAEGLATTEMGCDPPRHEQDEWFAGLLTSRPTLAVDGDELTLTAGDTVVRFVDREVAEPDRELVGTTWEVDGFADGDGPDDTAMSFGIPEPGQVRFEENGFVTGADGCNGFGYGEISDEQTEGLRYEVDGDRVVFTGNAAQTLIACPDLDEYVERFWSALTGTASWSIDADRLRLVGPDGRIVTFRAAD
jgi:heat shock protein HslJ